MLLPKSSLLLCALLFLVGFSCLDDICYDFLSISLRIPQNNLYSLNCVHSLEPPIRSHDVECMKNGAGFMPKSQVDNCYWVDAQTFVDKSIHQHAAFLWVFFAQLNLHRFCLGRCRGLFRHIRLSHSKDSAERVLGTVDGDRLNFFSGCRHTQGVSFSLSGCILQSKSFIAQPSHLFIVCIAF